MWYHIELVTILQEIVTITRAKSAFILIDGEVVDFYPSYVTFSLNSDRQDSYFIDDATTLIVDSSEDKDVCISKELSIVNLILEKRVIRNELEKLISESSDNTRDLFLASVSHEIRTPLNGVLGYSQLLSFTNLSVEQKDYINSMNKCAVQLLEIINDVLDYSKLACGKMAVTPECTSIRDIEHSVESVTRQWVANKKQNFTFTRSSSIPSFVILDKQKVIQVLVNLVSNASKFTGIGGKINVAIEHDKTNVLRFTVTDTGIGISKSDILRLFNMFVQLESSVRTGRGTGIGLSICKSLVELIGGKIDVTSVLGKGSVFTFTVPYEHVETISQRIENSAFVLKNKYVLVVDDNEDNRLFLSDMLFRWGMHPIVCASALEGLRLVMRNRYEFSIGLIDICMPGTTGAELAVQLKEERPMLPLIALSSADDVSSYNHFEQTLCKPVIEEVLFDTVLHVIQKREKPSAFIGSDSDLSECSASTPGEHFNKEVRILVAEDNMQNLDIIVKMLNRLGYKNIMTAVDGREALNLMDKTSTPYDILLLDLRMPNMDGYEVIKNLKLRNCKPPKIVVITASVLDCDKDRCSSMGIKYFVRKPIEYVQLEEVMLHVSEI